MTYTDWLANVQALLTHPDAIKCTLFADDRVLVAWYERGKGAEEAAQELNERYRRKYIDAIVVPFIFASTE